MYDSFLHDASHQEDIKPEIIQQKIRPQLLANKSDEKLMKYTPIRNVKGDRRVRTFKFQQPDTQPEPSRNLESEKQIEIHKEDPPVIMKTPLKKVTDIKKWIDVQTQTRKRKYHEMECDCDAITVSSDESCFESEESNSVTFMKQVEPNSKHKKKLKTYIPKIVTMMKKFPLKQRTKRVKKEGMNQFEVTNYFKSILKPIMESARSENFEKIAEAIKNWGVDKIIDSQSKIDEWTTEFMKMMKDLKDKVSAPVEKQIIKEIIHAPNPVEVKQVWVNWIQKQDSPKVTSSPSPPPLKRQVSFGSDNVGTWIDNKCTSPTKNLQQSNSLFSGLDKSANLSHLFSKQPSNNSEKKNMNDPNTKISENLTKDHFAQQKIRIEETKETGKSSDGAKKCNSESTESIIEGETSSSNSSVSKNDEKQTPKVIENNRLPSTKPVNLFTAQNSIKSNIEKEKETHMLEKTNLIPKKADESVLQSNNKAVNLFATPSSSNQNSSNANFQSGPSNFKHINRSDPPMTSNDCMDMDEDSHVSTPARPSMYSSSVMKTSALNNAFGGISQSNMQSAFSQNKMSFSNTTPISLGISSASKPGGHTAFSMLGATANFASKNAFTQQTNLLSQPKNQLFGGSNLSESNFKRPLSGENAQTFQNSSMINRANSSQLSQSIFTGGGPTASTSANSWFNRFQSANNPFSSAQKLGNDFKSASSIQKQGGSWGTTPFNTKSTGFSMGTKGSKDDDGLFNA